MPYFICHMAYEIWKAITIEFLTARSYLSGLHQFAPPRPRRQKFPGLLVEPLALLRFEDRAFDYAVDRLRAEVVLVVETVHPIEHLCGREVREIGHRQLLPQLVGHFVFEDHAVGLEPIIHFGAGVGVRDRDLERFGVHLLSVFDSLADSLARLAEQSDDEIGMDLD